MATAPARPAPNTDRVTGSGTIWALMLLEPQTWKSVPQAPVEDKVALPLNTMSGVWLRKRFEKKFVSRAAIAAPPTTSPTAKALDVVKEVVVGLKPFRVITKVVPLASRSSGATCSHRLPEVVIAAMSRAGEPALLVKTSELFV